MKVMLIGKDGQLGGEWQRLLFAKTGYSIVSFGRKELDITDSAAVLSKVKDTAPDIVINTTAYNFVDKAETECEKAFAVNGYGTANIAAACAKTGSLMVHYSTDYVFDGLKGTAYVETDEPNPVSVYARSKRAGELAVQQTAKKYILIRTSGVFGRVKSSATKGNFILTILRLARERKKLKIVNDQIVSPTYALDLAETSLEVVRKCGNKTYHITSSGECSWYEFAKEIVALAGIECCIEPISSKEYNAPAGRPPYSVLKSERLTELGITPLRHWREALKDYISSLDKEG